VALTTDLPYTTFLLAHLCEAHILESVLENY